MDPKPKLVVGLALGGLAVFAGCNAGRPGPLERVAHVDNTPVMKRGYVTVPSTQVAPAWPRTVILDYQEQDVPPQLEPVAPVDIDALPIIRDTVAAPDETQPGPDIVLDSTATMTGEPSLQSASAPTTGQRVYQSTPQGKVAQTGAAQAGGETALVVRSFVSETAAAPSPVVSAQPAPLPRGPSVPVAYAPPQVVVATPMAAQATALTQSPTTAHTPTITQTSTITQTPTIAHTPAITQTVAPQSFPAPQAPAGEIRYLTSRLVSLDLQVKKVGHSGIKKVHAWGTQDGGVTWKSLNAQVRDSNHLDVHLPADGLFGLRLSATNGNGLGGAAPASGTQPTYLVEVDNVVPLLKLGEVKLSPSSDAIDIRWTVSDKNLGTDSISIYYRTNDKGAWAPVGLRLKNDGYCRWIFPRSAGTRFYIRVMATDKAGNSSHADTPTPIETDRTVPELSITGIQSNR